MVKKIYDYNADSEDTPLGAVMVQTSESNLDIVQFIGDYDLDLANEDEFEYYDATNTKIFAGFIRSSENGDTSNYVGYDYGIELAQIPIRKNFENFTALEIIEDVITNFTSLTWVSPTGITDSEEIILYPSSTRTASQVIDAMHKLLGTTHYVDFDKNFMIEYEGQEFNTNTLTVGSNCNTTDDGWVSDTIPLVKNLRVAGAIKTIEEIQTLTGDGSSQEFTLSSPYTDIKIEYPSGSGTYLTPNVDDIIGGDYDIYRETKKIKFTSITPPNGTTFDVYYVYQIETDFTIKEVSDAEILTGVNPYYKNINVSYLKEVADCKNYATKYKNKFKNPLRTVQLIVNTMDASKYRANQSVRIVDNTHLVNGEFIDDTFIIKTLERSFGTKGYFLRLTCGDSENFIYDRNSEINQRVNELNETNPTADIFNTGITTTTDSQLEIEYEVTTALYKGTLPTDILVSDVATRVSVNEADYTGSNGFKSINELTYNALFYTVGASYIITNNGDRIVTNDIKRLMVT